MALSLWTSHTKWHGSRSKRRQNRARRSLMILLITRKNGVMCLSMSGIKSNACTPFFFTCSSESFMIIVIENVPNLTFCDWLLDIEMVFVNRPIVIKKWWYLSMMQSASYVVSKISQFFIELFKITSYIKYRQTLIGTITKLIDFLFLFFADQKMSINPGSYKLSEKTGKLTSAGKFRIINKHTALSWGAMIIRQYANVFAIALRYLNPWFAIIQLIFRHAPPIIVYFDRYRHISFFYETTFHPNSFTFNLII